MEPIYGKPAKHTPGNGERVSEKGKVSIVINTWTEIQ